jgi:hypothetical protein
VTERYIPPTSSFEFVNLFNPSGGGSLLSDRLVELSEDSGLLIFIYPTKAGGTTFVHDYLGTILDPTLRRMMIVRELGPDLCQQIGTMQAVEDMASYEELCTRFTDFCELISSSTSSPSVSSKFQTSDTQTIYSVVHASRRIVTLPPEVWADWWCKQEKTRIRKAFADYISQNPSRARSVSGAASMAPAARARLREEPSSDGVSMTYIIEVMEGVERAAREKAGTLTKGIEVALFAVRKKLLDPDGSERD